MNLKTIKRMWLLCCILSISMSFSQTGVQNYLTANGNKLVDKRGQTVYLTGVNWFGFETSNMFPHGIWTRDMKSVLKQIKDLGFNTIRIPWCNQMLNASSTIKINSYGTDSYSGVSPMNEIEGTKTKPIELLDIIVDWCQANNMKIILDNHSKKTDGFLNEGLWYTDGYDEARWITDWVFLANRYKGKSAMIGCDLKNEPHQSTWGNSNPLTDFNKASERCGNAILQANPELLIFVEGVAKYNGETSWWGGQLKGAKDFPVVLSNPKKLVYSPHEYGPEIFVQTWFNDPTFPNNMAGVWNNNFDYLYQNNTAPLFVGEFGIKDQNANGGKALTWFKTFAKFMGGKYNWTYWSLNPNSGDTGGILTDDWTTVNQWKMDVLKPYLQPLIPNVVNGTVGNQAPTASFTTDKTSGTPPLTVKFDATNSSDPEGGALTYSWDFGDTTATGTAKIVSHVYATVGTFKAVLTVKDPQNATSTSFVNIVVANVTTTSSTITASVVGANGTISPTGAVSVLNGTNKTFTITPNSGYQIDAVSVNNLSVGAVSSYTFTNVTTNQSISATFKAVVVGNNCLLARFNVPRATALPNISNVSFSKVYTLGQGAPNLSNVTNAVVNWDLTNNGLYQLSFNTNNGIPNWYIDMRSNVQNFAQPQSAITFAGTGIIGLDGNKYYVNLEGSNIVLVEITGKHAIYFSNSATPPVGCATTARLASQSTTTNSPLEILNAYPNPIIDFLKVDVSGKAKSKQIIIYDLSGKMALQKQVNPNTEEETLDMSKLPTGLYQLIFTADNNVTVKSLIKQ
jgi:endoglucanase